MPKPKAKPKDTAVRANITIPPDVPPGMDAVKEPVNWSAVATEAFRAKLLELESRKAAGNNMERAIERLRASKKKHQDEQYRIGREAGARWAMDEAETPELERLARFDDEDTDGWQSHFDVADNGMNSGVGAMLAEVLMGDTEESGLRPWEFWENVFGDKNGIEKVNDHGFALGFIESALEFWRTAEKQL